jgi:pantoate--beta-alanine ligase
MLVIETINDLSRQIELAKTHGQTIGFVPTMGALHLGHLDLVKKARQKSDLVVVSIFVNPTQFNNPDDLLKYPKTLEADLKILDDWAHIVFVPTILEMYPTAFKKSWHFGLLSSTLEGFYRPGHFDGVCTIVQMLFDAVKPHRAFFGKKDYQQLAVIKALVQSENIPVEIIPCDTIRDRDGLAMSSRNMRLSANERTKALTIHRTLTSMVAQKSKLSVDQLLSWGRTQFSDRNGLQLEYLEIVDAHTFEPLQKFNHKQLAVILIAAYAGEIRLIDNMEVQW